MPLPSIKGFVPAGVDGVLVTIATDFSKNISDEGGSDALSGMSAIRIYETNVAKREQRELVNL